MVKRLLFAFACFVTLLIVSATTAYASYGIYVGSERTADGSVLIGGTGDEVSSHWLKIEPRQKHGPDETIEVGVTGEATFPGELIEIPQVEETAKYISMDYSDYEGFPAPLTNGGLNEHGVAGRDIWSPSRQALIDMTPEPQRGPNYSDLSRIAMERATTSREAVEIIGDLMDEHGYSTYGGNSHMFADNEEGWVVINFAGGEGLWVAERLGADEVRMSYPGYIGDIPEDYQDDPDFMGSDNLISFAEEQGWYDSDSGEPFNVHEVYGDQDAPMRSETVEEIEGRLTDMGSEVTVNDMMATVRDPIVSSDTNGYGQVARLTGDRRHDDLANLWVAPTGSVTAPFIPWYIGATEVPPEFGEHRYMTKGAASNFLNPDYQSQEATEFAGRTFKRLMYHTCEHPDKFLPEVNEALEAFEEDMLDEQQSVRDTAYALYNAGQEDLAQEYLTTYSTERAMEGLELGQALLGSIEARTEVLYGIREPEGDQINSDGETIDCNPAEDSE
ncbi:C69 family dipeptidase [Rubrobacter indicoceani]|uniref:C69 family dipeptidase n=1 Tax=Rubrobacter indicoceani TaxID=2051957 RepID=UPI000E5A8F97|nr:C69 family dipeptidase [Rubrobacter indicoceani]